MYFPMLGKKRNVSFVKILEYCVDLTQSRGRTPYWNTIVNAIVFQYHPFFKMEFFKMLFAELDSSRTEETLDLTKFLFFYLIQYLKVALDEDVQMFR